MFIKWCYSFISKYFNVQSFCWHKILEDIKEYLWKQLQIKLSSNCYKFIQIKHQYGMRCNGIILIFNLYQFLLKYFQNDTNTNNLYSINADIVHNAKNYIIKLFNTYINKNKRLCYAGQKHKIILSDDHTAKKIKINKNNNNEFKNIKYFEIIDSASLSTRNPNIKIKSSKHGDNFGKMMYSINRDKFTVKNNINVNVNNHDKYQKTVEYNKQLQTYNNKLIIHLTELQIKQNEMINDINLRTKRFNINEKKLNNIITTQAKQIELLTKSTKKKSKKIKKLKRKINDQ